MTTAEGKKTRKRKQKNIRRIVDKKTVKERYREEGRKCQMKGKHEDSGNKENVKGKRKEDVNRAGKGSERQKTSRG